MNMKFINRIYVTTVIFMFCEVLFGRTNGVCDSGMHEIAGSCYIHHGPFPRITAYEAETACPTTPGHYLASFGSQEELDAVYTYFSSRTTVTANLAIWAVNESIGVPSSNNGCVVIGYGSVLRTEECTIDHAYLCETDLEGLTTESLSTTTVTEVMTTTQTMTTSPTSTSAAVVTTERPATTNLDNPTTTMSSTTPTSFLTTGLTSEPVSTTVTEVMTTTQALTNPTSPTRTSSVLMTTTNVITTERPATTNHDSPTTAMPSTTPAISSLTTGITSEPVTTTKVMTTTQDTTSPTSISSALMTTTDLITTERPTTATHDNPTTTMSSTTPTTSFATAITTRRTRISSFAVVSAAVSLSQTDVIRTLDNIRTPLHCAAKCSSLDSCHVFTYSSANQMCYLGTAGGVDNLQDDASCNTYKIIEKL